MTMIWFLPIRRTLKMKKKMMMTAMAAARKNLFLMAFRPK